MKEGITVSFIPPMDTACNGCGAMEMALEQLPEGTQLVNASCFTALYHQLTSAIRVTPISLRTGALEDIFVDGKLCQAQAPVDTSSSG